MHRAASFPYFAFVSSETFILIPSFHYVRYTDLWSSTNDSSGILKIIVWDLILHQVYNLNKDQYCVVGSCMELILFCYYVTIVIPFLFYFLHYYAFFLYNSILFGGSHG